MRVVIDINILVSALIAPTGQPADVIRIWLDGQFTLLTCATHSNELRATLHKPKVAELIEPHKAGRLVNQVKSSPRTLTRCRAWSVLPIPTTITCWRCPRLVRRITS